MEHDDTIARARREHDDDSIEGGWGKFFVRVTGKITVIIVIILSVACAPTYLLWKHDQESQKMLSDIHSSIKEGNEIQQAQLWLQAQPDAVKYSQNLAKPRKIVEMQR